jgi:ribonucleoside-triphosphate reductase
MKEFVTDGIRVIKKDGTYEDFDYLKIVNAVTKSASRVMVKLDDEQYDHIVSLVLCSIAEKGYKDVPITDMHNMVEYALVNTNEQIAKSYRDYRNYKIDFVHMMDKVYERSQAIRYIGDKENANTDSSLVATKRSLIYNELNKRLYRKFFMTIDERLACREGYIYIHDQSARLDTMNCCLFDMDSVVTGGFEMGNVWYNEPKTLDVMFDVIGDIVLSTASQQYGGFTVSEIDKLLSKYAQKSYDLYYNEYINQYKDMNDLDVDTQTGDTLTGFQYEIPERITYKADKYAMRKVRREFDQGFQGIEMKLNTVGSSRGDYPFITMTFGLATDTFGRMASLSFLNVHMNGQGKAGYKKPVLFPKLVFLYDKDLHGPGGVNEDIYEAAVECSSKTMYPKQIGA